MRVNDQTSHKSSNTIILECFVTNTSFDLYERATASGKTVPINSSSSVNTKCVLCRGKQEKPSMAKQVIEIELTLDAGYSA
jgi:hypothetical protein